MKTKIFLLLVLLALFNTPGIISGAYAQEDATTEDTAAYVITLEKALELAIENSRDMAKYEINKEKAKYQMYKAREDYRETVNRSYGLLSKYNQLESEYWQLVQDYNKTADETEKESIRARMLEKEDEMDQLYEELEKQSGQEDSALDQKEYAEDDYDDIVTRQASYEKQLAYTVTRLYINILNQEGNLQSLNKEYTLKQKLLDIEKRKLLLGRTDRASVDNLSVELKQLNRDIIVLNNSIETQKGKLNDMMGRKYEDKLELAHFEVPESVELPEPETLVSKATEKYDGLEDIKEEIDKKKNEQDSVSESDYQHDVLELEIKELKLQLEEEKLALKERINNLIIDAQSKLEEYLTALTSYSSTQQNYTWDQKRYDLGRISELELLQSELNCQKAKEKSISAGYSFYLTCRALELAGNGILVD